MDGGNEIQAVEKYETRKKDDKDKVIYDKVMKALGLTSEILDEKD